MNEKAVKVIYATLQLMEVAFKMYKTNSNNTTIFCYKDNTIVVTDTDITVNNDVINFADIVPTIKAL